MPESQDRCSILQQTGQERRQKPALPRLCEGAAEVLKGIDLYVALEDEAEIDVVLGSSRTELIFTRSQEATQPGGLTQAGQATGCLISCASMLGSSGRGEASRGSGAQGAPGSESCSLHFAVCFVYSPYQYCCCYCLLFFCCSVTLPLSRPTGFLPFSFHSPPYPSGERGSRATEWPFCCSHGQTVTGLN